MYVNVSGRKIHRHGGTPHACSMQTRGARLVEIFAHVVAEQEQGVALDGVWWNCGRPFLKDGPNTLLVRAGPHCVDEEFSASSLENVGYEGLAAKALQTVREMLARLEVVDHVERNIASQRVSPDPRLNRI